MQSPTTPNNSVRNILILDATTVPSERYHKVIYWRDVLNMDCEDVSENRVSISDLVEKNSASLKEQYLSWVYELGNLKIGERRLIDHLEIRSNFSYWWMTLFAAKNNISKSTNIDDAIRFLAFNIWASEGAPISNIELVSANAPLAECMRIWCVERNIGFIWRRAKTTQDPVSVSIRIYNHLPKIVQALIWLGRYIIERWPLRKIGVSRWFQSKAKVTFVSYFFNLSPSASERGEFESNYWAHLPKTLHENGCKINWLHLYVRSTTRGNVKSDASLLKKFNENVVDHESHVTLDSFLDITVIVKALKDWCFLLITGFKMKRTVANSSVTNINLFPLFANDWARSFFGPDSLHNCLYLNLFETALGNLPIQQTGVYLEENQPWELALIRTWESCGHGKLIGCPHSTVRYWDLRYFADPRTYDVIIKNNMPLPTTVALNGPIMREMYVSSGFPINRLVDVEALRYMYLAERPRVRPRPFRPSNEPIQMLVVGDYLSINTRRQMKLLSIVAPALPTNVSIVIKPHPNCPISLADIGELNAEITHGHISTLLYSADLVYSSATTSAAVDAYSYGIPVLSLLDSNNLNLSPLRGCRGVFYVRNATEFMRAFETALTSADQQTIESNFFFLDKSLFRWMQLLRSNH